MFIYRFNSAVMRQLFRAPRVKLFQRVFALSALRDFRRWRARR